MSFNILTAVQEKLQLPGFIKADPNTQDIENGTPQLRLAQSCATAVLTAMYEVSKTENGLTAIADEPLHSDWSNVLFGENKEQVLQNIAQYAGYDLINTEIKINELAVATVSIVRDHVSKDDKHRYDETRSLLKDQRDFILPYLPAALQMGPILNDNTLDDRTNKMSGPMSTLINKIQTSFNSAATAAEATEKQFSNK
jgi:hypothetical protein